MGNSSLDQTAAQRDSALRDRYKADAEKTRESMRSLMRWIERGILRDPSAREWTAVAYRHYLAWCQENGYFAHSSIAWGRAVRGAGFQDSRNAKGRYFMGLRLIQKATEPINTI